MDCCKGINEQAIEKLVKDFLIALGENPDREGLIETPARVAHMCEEIFAGIKYSNDDIARMFGKCFSEESKDMVIMKDIPIFSFCEHHIALMYNMVVHVAYIPNGKVIGLSKIARIADMVGRRLQLQERIGNDIADIIQTITESNDVMIIIEGEHSCMSIRGIRMRGTKTKTIVKRGVFCQERSACDEVLEFTNN